MTRKILVTGAGGFVGSHLAQGFAALGDRVTGIDLAFDSSTRERLTGATIVEAGLGEGLAQLPSFDVVIHGAALTTEPEMVQLSPAAHLQVNVDLLLASLDFAMRSRAGTFVFLSSSGVFEASMADVLLESTPACSIAPYALAKRAGELLLAMAAANGIRAITVRLGPIYGDHERSRPTRARVSLVRQWLDAAAAQTPIVVESPLSRRDWTFAADLAPAIDALLDEDIDGVVHLCAPQIISDYDLAVQIAEVANASIILAQSTAPPRRPMSSERIDLPHLIDWTSLPTGLTALVCGAR